MSAAPQQQPKSFVSLGVAGAVVLLVAIFGGLLPALVIALALLGTPLFAVMGGASELAWLRHPDELFHHFRYIAPRVLDDHFAGSPILVTIPLFTFVGYVLARARTAERLVRFSSALLGWIPGGLAIVCVLASAVFTLLTGGSGVTIIAIGGLLLPALKREGYSDNFSLGIITSGGSLGLLLPLSLPLMVYALVAGVDLNAASLAVIAPGVLVLIAFTVYAVWVGIREKIPTKPFDLNELMQSFWDLKWEALIPVIMGVSIGVLQLNIDEAAGLVAFYTVIIEVFVYRDLSFRRDMLKVTKSAMSMAGAVILILTMANALVNYVIQERIPDAIFDKMTHLGLDQTWQFLLVMNVFLLALGMVMEGFSAIFVAVPLIIPFAARFHLGPFHVGMIFLLNLELAFCMPPLGLNLFISSFRFNRPATSLYRPILPFLGLLGASLLLISYVPSISNVMVRGKIEALREKAINNGDPPREAWLLECVQEDTLNPQPCTPEDRAKWPDGKAPEPEPEPNTDTPPDTNGAEPSGEDDDLLKQMMGGGDEDAGGSSSSGGSSDDDLLKEMMGGGAASGEDAGAAPSASGAGAEPEAPKGDEGKIKSDEELLKEMMGE